MYSAYIFHSSCTSFYIWSQNR